VRADGEREVVAVRGADNLDELPLGCGEDHGEALAAGAQGQRGGGV
jgi:hypothetical protein